MEILKHYQKSVLFHNEVVWIKKFSYDNFDVTVESFDEAEVCEFIYHCLNLSIIKMATVEERNVGLYQDDDS